MESLIEIPVIFDVFPIAESCANDTKAICLGQDKTFTFKWIYLMDSQPFSLAIVNQ